LWFACSFEEKKPQRDDKETIDLLDNEGKQPPARSEDELEQQHENRRVLVCMVLLLDTKQCLFHYGLIHQK
jgi:hypothetical protein